MLSECSACSILLNTCCGYEVGIGSIVGSRSAGCRRTDVGCASAAGASTCGHRTPYSLDGEDFQPDSGTTPGLYRERPSEVEAPHARRMRLVIIAPAFLLQIVSHPSGSHLRICTYKASPTPRARRFTSMTSRDEGRSSFGRCRYVFGSLTDPDDPVRGEFVLHQGSPAVAAAVSREQLGSDVRFGIDITNNGAASPITVVGAGPQDSSGDPTNLRLTTWTWCEVLSAWGAASRQSPASRSS